MANLLRQIVAGPRVRHPEANLDLCYVTDQIIATSGPSATWPQLAYRNPLDQLVKFLDSKHGEDWAIWEFRAEGTGYPDDQVYNRIWHYPWPDHHPPPFALIPNMMASMRNWLKGKEGRVVVVHCKAGKGRSGTASCAYLISECGWTPKDAIERFTERRMRPGFGVGVSIPSQVRWVGYIERWAKHGKIYIENPLEILEVHVWGLKDGVKVSVEGFINEGKQIKTFHIFKKKERMVLDDATSEKTDEKEDKASDKPAVKAEDVKDVVEAEVKAEVPEKSSTIPLDASHEPKKPLRTDTAATTRGSEVGGEAVILKPREKIVVPTSDVNIDFERRNRARYGLTMVTSVSHVWFNAFFEGQGPEKGGKAEQSGTFEIEWDALDGIKGSSKKGVRSFDKLAVVWRISTDGDKKDEVVLQPKEGEEVPQAQPADWKGDNKVEDDHAALGLRKETVNTADVSRASSIKDGPSEADGAKPDEDGGEDEMDLKQFKSDAELALQDETSQSPTAGHANEAASEAKADQPPRASTEPAPEKQSITEEGMKSGTGAQAGDNPQTDDLQPGNSASAENSKTEEASIKHGAKKSVDRTAREMSKIGWRFD